MYVTLNIHSAISMRLSRQKWLKTRIDTALMLLLLSLALPAFADANADIQRLINRVGALEEATFIRNGRDYSAAYAKEFLQRKWQAQCKSAASVQAFIDTCASTSSTSGKRYLIKQNGTARPASDVLRELAAQTP
jgi:hypothetical protein